MLNLPSIGDEVLDPNEKFNDLDGTTKYDQLLADGSQVDVDKYPILADKIGSAPTVFLGNTSISDSVNELQSSQSRIYIIDDVVYLTYEDIYKVIDGVRVFVANFRVLSGNYPTYAVTYADGLRSFVFISSLGRVYRYNIDTGVNTLVSTISGFNQSYAATLTSNVSGSIITLWCRTTGYLRFKSTDGGATWDTGTAVEHASICYPTTIGDTIVVPTANAMSISEDGGDTWRLIDPPTSSGNNMLRVLSLDYNVWASATSLTANVELIDTVTGLALPTYNPTYATSNLIARDDGVWSVNIDLSNLVSRWECVYGSRVGDTYDESTEGLDDYTISTTMYSAFIMDNASRGYSCFSIGNTSSRGEATIVGYTQGYNAYLPLIGSGSDDCPYRIVADLTEDA